MTRKDYILIATTVAGLDMDPCQRGDVARAFCRSLETTNPRFDSPRFFAACFPDTDTEV